MREFVLPTQERIEDFFILYRCAAEAALPVVEPYKTTVFFMIIAIIKIYIAKLQARNYIVNRQ